MSEKVPSFREYVIAQIDLKRGEIAALERGLAEYDAAVSARLKASRDTPSPSQDPA